jgi:hypothetical protein
MVSFRSFFLGRHTKILTPRGDDGRSLFFPRGKNCDLAEFPSKNKSAIERNLTSISPAKHGGTAARCAAPALSAAVGRQLVVRAHKRAHKRSQRELCRDVLPTASSVLKRQHLGCER